MRRRPWLVWLFFSLLLGGLSGCASAEVRATDQQLDRLEQSLYNEALQNFRRGFDPVVVARWATNDTGS